MLENENIHDDENIENIHDDTHSDIISDTIIIPNIPNDNNFILKKYKSIKNHIKKYGLIHFKKSLFKELISIKINSNILSIQIYEEIKKLIFFYFPDSNLNEEMDFLILKSKIILKKSINKIDFYEFTILIVKLLYNFIELRTKEVIDLIIFLATKLKLIDELIEYFKNKPDYQLELIIVKIKLKKKEEMEKEEINNHDLLHDNKEEKCNHDILLQDDVSLHDDNHDLLHDNKELDLNSHDVLHDDDLKYAKSLIFNHDISRPQIAKFILRMSIDLLSLIPDSEIFLLMSKLCINNPDIFILNLHKLIYKQKKLTLCKNLNNFYIPDLDNLFLKIIENQNNHFLIYRTLKITSKVHFEFFYKNFLKNENDDILLFINNGEFFSRNSEFFILLFLFFMKNKNNENLIFLLNFVVKIFKNEDEYFEYFEFKDEINALILKLKKELNLSEINNKNIKNTELDNNNTNDTNINNNISDTELKHELNTKPFNNNNSDNNELNNSKNLKIKFFNEKVEIEDLLNEMNLNFNLKNYFKNEIKKFILKMNFNELIINLIDNLEILEFYDFEFQDLILTMLSKNKNWRIRRKLIQKLKNEEIKKYFTNERVFMVKKEIKN